MIRILAIILKPFLKLLDFLTPLADLLARLWISWMFFQAGLVKIQAWQSTVNLFTYEYSVPLLPPTTAAIIGTVLELVLPVLLVLGLGGRITILIFFLYNIVAAASYHYLWTPMGWSGLSQHINWGLLLALLMTHGPGKLSLDYWIRREYGHHLENKRESEPKE
ncbi:DoxX family protein [Candidiatus Paracoxiella cheracis]|uniref:DoxX family protein n=1 Tax=Candidiatus Paracoxiella cheracis TaxID=3405120 RepID=UPI003BF48381